MPSREVELEEGLDSAGDMGSVGEGENAFGRSPDGERAALWGPERIVSQAEGLARPKGTELACLRNGKSSRVVEWRD